MNIIFLVFGGALGVLARYYSQIVCGALFSSNWLNSGLLVINSIGCLLFSFLLGYFFTDSPSTWRYFWLSGFCGGYTTFSAFAYEALTFAQKDQWLLGLCYTMMSVCLGIFCIFLGLKLGTALKHTF